MVKVKNLLSLRNIAIAIAGILVLLGLEHQWSIHRALGRMADDPMGAVLGPQTSRNTIVEFMDYRCSGCRVFSATMAQFRQKHPDVRIVIRHDPMYGDASVREAELSLAAARQGGFEAMHTVLTGRADPLPAGEIPDLARQLGLDPAKIAADMKDRAMTHHLADTLRSMDLLGIPSAPSFIINGTIYVPPSGPVPDLARFEAVYARLTR